MKINLVPEVKQDQIRIRKINMLLTTIASITGVVLVAVILLLTVYIGIRKAQISRIEAATDKVNTELEVYKDLEQTVISLETGLREAKDIIDGGPKWVNFMTELEKVTPADISLSNLSVKGNELTMRVNGRDVKSIDRFIKSFSNYKIKDKNLFTNVSVSSYSKKGTAVAFDAKMNLDKGLLW